MTKAENNAEELIFDLGLTLPIIPKDVCDKLHSDSFTVNYQEKKLNSTKLCGISIGSPESVEILINTSITNESRRKFTTAHEIGHAVMHIQTGLESQFECSKNDISGKENSNKTFEKEANEFASSLLMPKKLIGNKILRNDLSWQLIQSISKDCQTSLEATARRIVRLSDEACVLIIHKNGAMWTPIKSPSFKTYINTIPFPRNLDTSPDLIGQELPETMYECDTSDWLTDYKEIPEIIFYSSIKNEEYDRTMTLLLIPEIDEDDQDEWEEPKFSR